MKIFNFSQKFQKVFFVDPMSYNNLAEYDYKLLTGYLPANFKVYFFGNTKYNLNSTPKKTRLIFNYSNYSNKILKMISYIISWLKVFFFSIFIRPDIIHIQWLKVPQFDYWMICLMKLFSPNRKIIFTAHNILPHNSGKKHFETFQNIYSKIDHIIIHTFISKSELIDEFRISPSKLTVIPHGLLSMEYDNNIANSFIEKYNNKFELKDKLVFLMIGGISTYKGVDILLDAWNDEEKGLKSKKDCLLIIAGKGDIDYQKPIADNCIIINKFLTNEEFIALIEIGDIIVFPYRKISQSGVLLTVLSKHKPICVTPVGGLTEPFEIGEIGWISKSTECKDLIQILNEIYTSKNKIDEIKNNKELWKKIDTYYDWKKISKQTYNLYKNLLLS